MKTRAPGRPLIIAVTPKTMVVAVAVLSGAWVLSRLLTVVLVVTVALILVGTLSPAVEWLEKKGLGRGKGIALVFTTMMLALLGVLALAIPALVQQVGALLQAAPLLQERLAERLSHSTTTRPLADAIAGFHYEEAAKAQVATAFQYSTHALEVAAYIVSAVFLSLYVMVDRDRLRGALYALVPRTHHIKLSRVLLSLQTIVGGYLRGQIVTSVMMAAFTFLLLLVCRVKSALAIGVLAGVADVLPYVGVFLAVGPAVGAALARGPAIAVAVFVSMMAYEELESRLIVPRVYGNALKLPSSIVLFSLLVGSTLLGIPGALLALPVAAAIRMLVAELRVELPGEDIDDSDLRESDARAEREYKARVGGLPAEVAAAIAVEIEQRRDVPLPPDGSPRS